MIIIHLIPVVYALHFSHLRSGGVSLSTIAQNSSLLPPKESYPCSSLSVAGHTFISATDLRLGSLSSPTS